MQFNKKMLIFFMFFINSTEFFFNVKYFFIKFKFHSFCQSGGYFDFFFKKISEIFVSNFFVYSSQFLGEKYMMEYLTKNMFNKSIFYFNKLIGSNNLNYFDFLYNILINLFYIMIFICIIYLFI